MKKTIYILTLIMITLYSCSSDDNENNNPEDPQNECSAPDNDLRAENITASSAVLRWFGISRDFYQVEYGLNGFSQGNGTMSNANENELLVEGLSSDTAYDFYVRGNCGGSEFSDWTGPHSFVTD